MRLLIVSLTALVAFGGCSSSLVTPEMSRNKEIEQRAAETRDATLCEQISGHSYRPGPTDGPMKIDEAEAKQLCRNSAASGEVVVGG